MVVKVKGIQAAWDVAIIMQDETGIETRPYRGDETKRYYWVSNTHLEPPGEQKVLDALAGTGKLLYCAGCSHHKPMSWIEYFALRPRAYRRVVGRTRERLAEEAHRFGPNGTQGHCSTE
jgi:hypothetical protein